MDGLTFRKVDFMMIERDIWWKNRPVYLVAHVTEEECEARIYNAETGDRIHLDYALEIELEERAITIYEDLKNQK